MLPGSWPGKFLLGVVGLFLKTQLAFSHDAAPRVVSMTPNSGRMSDNHPVKVSGSMSLTATFSHAMIALGSDFGEGDLPENLIPFSMEPKVEGKWRWVSTSVIRFDPAGGWPSELDLTLSLKADARDVSGNEIVATTKWQFRTPSLILRFDSVMSKRAQEVTGGQWDAMAYEPEGPEVPPDGVIRVHFSDNVDTEMLSKSLQLVSSESSEIIPVHVERCSATPYMEPSRCIEIKLQKPLAVGLDYKLQLPTGATFHSRAGAVRKATSLPLRGLLPFAFPFQTAQRQVQYKRQRIHVRHGLAENVSMPALLRLFELTPPVANLNLTKKAKAEIELSGDFQPGTSYTLRVQANASVLDGFGLPLKASECTFHMSNLTSVLMGPQSLSTDAFTLLPPASLHSGVAKDNKYAVQWPVMFRGEGLCLNESKPCAKPQFAQTAAISADNVKESITLLMNHQYGNMQSETSLPQAAGSEIVQAPLKAETDLEHLNIRGWQLLSHHRQNQFNGRGRASRFQSMGMPNVESSIVGVSDTIMSIAVVNAELVVWALRQDGAGSLTPISDATVAIFSAPYRLSKPADVQELAKAKTSADGTVKLSLDVDGSMGGLWATLTDSDGEMALHRLQNIWIQQDRSQGRTAAFAASIITDRGIYKPGDNMFVKVYVHRDGQDGTLAALTDVVLHVHFDNRVETPVRLTLSKYGTAEANLTVPANSTLGHKSIRLSATYDQQRVQRFRGNYQRFLVADPRPPTVSLDVASTQDIIQTNGTHPVSGVEVSVDTKTLSGVPIGGAEVTMRWRIPRRCSMYTPSYRTDVAYDEDLEDSNGEDECRDDEGKETLVTKPDGHLDYVWKPDCLIAKPAFHRDTVTLEFEWVGPTRERLQKQLSIPITFATFDLRVFSRRQNVLPGVPFSMEVTARQLWELGDKPLVGKEVSFSLHEAGEDALTERDTVPKTLLAMEQPIQKCVAVTGDEGKTESCDLTVPSVGHFAVIACMDNERKDSDAVCSVVPIGRNQTEWEKRPLQNFLEEAVSFTTDKEEYEAGETPVISFHNPREDSSMLYAWRCAASTSLQTGVKSKLPKGRATFTLPAMTRGNDCQASVMLMSPGSDSNQVPVPVARLFDPSLPEYVEHQIRLRVRRETSEVTVTLTPENKLAEPGSEQTVKVELQNADGSPARGEVCIFAVDRAMLDLQPHPVVNLTESMKEVDNYGDYFQTYSSQRSLVSADVLNFTTSWLMRLAEVDPWLLGNGEVQWHLLAGFNGYRGGFGDLFDKSPEEAAAHFHSTLTKWVSRHGYMGRTYDDDGDVEESAMDGMAMGGAAPAMAMESAPLMRSGNGGMMMKARTSNFAMADESSASSPDGGSGHQARIRSDFVYTPLFRTLVVDGSADVRWKLPDNIGKFELRAYVVAEESKEFGGAVAEQIVRQKVALTASVPRITRIGDNFSCGVTVTATGVTTAMKLDVDLQMGVASFIELGNHASSTLSIPADVSTTKEVTFAMQATRIGEQRAVVTVSHEGSELDKLELLIPVLAPQPEVYVATSIAIPAHASTDMSASLWEEGVVVPDSINGTGHLHMSAGVGNLPAVKGLVQSLLPVRSLADYPGPSAVELLCNMGSLAALAPYPQDSVSSQRGEVSSKLHQIVRDLQTLTTESMGLRYRVPRGSSSGAPDVRLNCIAVYLLRRLHLAKVELPPTVESLLQTLQQQWARALVNGLEEMVQEARSASKEFSEYGLLSMAKLALGAEHVPSREVDDLWRQGLSKLMEGRDNLSMRSKAELAIIHMLPADHTADARFKAPRQPKGQVLDLVNHLASCLRVSGRTAYVTASPTSAHAAADFFTQGMVLTALSLAKQSFAEGLPEELPLSNLDKLAKYVGRGVEGNAGMSALSSAFGLADYDAAVHNTEANVNLTAWLGQDKVHVSHISTESPAHETSSMDMALVRSEEVAPMLFDASGIGEVSVGLGIRFIPAKLPHEPVYRGIEVQRVVQLFDHKLNGPKGTPLSAVPVGSLLTVSLQIAIPDDTFGLVVEDWLPAGIEALDPNVGHEYMHALGGRPFYGGFRSFCPSWEQETKKDRVLFHSTFVSAGTHTLTYQAMAVTRGTFLLPPARASAVFEPEVMGMSPGGTFTVDDKAEQVEHAAPEVHMCPSDCNGRGTCDATEGKCMCFPGSSGADCSETPSVPILELDPLSFLSGDSIKEETITIQAGSSRTLVVRLGGETAGQAAETLKWLLGIPQLMPQTLASDRRLDGQGSADELLRVERDEQSGGLVLTASNKAKDGTVVLVNIMGSVDGALFGKKRVVARIHSSDTGSDVLTRDDVQSVGAVTDTSFSPTQAVVLAGAAAVAVLALLGFGAFYFRRAKKGWQQVPQPEAAQPDVDLEEQPGTYTKM